MKRTIALVFHPPTPAGDLTELVGAARRAATEDLIANLRSLGIPSILSTPAVEAPFLRDLDAEIHESAPGTDFHFGRTLHRILRETKADAVLYFGSGSGCLLETRHLERLAQFIERSDAAVLLNNFYSCDFAAISDVASIAAIDPPGTDNALGFALADAGIACHALPRDAASQFDIDVPIDLLLLKAFERGGPRLRGVLATWGYEHPSLEALCQCLTNRTALVQLGGRIQPATWQAFEQATACRTAGFSEGRGLRSYPDRRTPLLQGILSTESGAFFDRLEAACDAAILDTRALLPLAPGGRLPPAADRFASDLFLSSRVQDPHWRAVTEAAAESAIPLLLGGHNLVSGGLFLLADVCWKGRNLPRRLHPDPFSWKEE